MGREVIDAGWFAVPSSVSDRRTFHYFRAGVPRSLCGNAASYQVPRDADRFEALSSVALTIAPFCRGCDRTRRPQEGR